MYIRPATVSDLDFMTQNHIAAFQDDAQWNYRFPNREKFPESHYRMTKVMLKSFLDAPEKFVIMVACSKTLQDPDVVETVFHSIWRTVDIHVSTKTST
jgi:hypothetical protein